MSRRLLMCVLALSIGSAACTYETRKLPPVLPTPSESSTIVARDGTVITVLQAEENRENIALEKMPQHLVDAVIAIEDERFYRHNGVDLTAVFRAASSNVGSGEIAEGGSTITQQYVKNAYLDDEQTVGRKIEEAALAFQLERTYSKDLILELYLNTIYFGRGQYGVQAASFEYFNKPTSDVDLAEAALLAGMIQSPSNVDPYLRPGPALDRRDIVLDRMLELGTISDRDHRQAITAPLEVAEQQAPELVEDEYAAAHFVEEVKQWIINNPRFGETRDERINLLFGGGLRIHTTIDLELQAQAEAAVAQVLPDPRSYPDAAVVTLDPQTGQVLAMVGGRDYWGTSSYARYNLAGGKGRQSGSAFKPLVLATALESGMPVVRTYPGPGFISIVRPEAPLWQVKGGCGLVTLVEATVQSCNTVYAQLIMDVGAEDAIETAHRLGVRSELETNEAAVLGTNDVTALDMASAFGTFANHGIAVPPVLVRRIVQSDGTVLYEHDVVGRAVLEPAVADLVTWTLEQVVQRGTGTRARLDDRPAAGKTGTTENSWDAWFVGYTPQRVTAVWVGFPEAPIPMRPPTTPITVYGGTWPADIWKLVMTDAHADLAPEDFVDPPPEIFVGVGSEGAFVDNQNVPNVLGMPLGKAIVELARAGYLPGLYWRDETDPSIPLGRVLDQWPSPHDVLRVGRTVTLEIARPAPKSPAEDEPGDDPGNLPVVDTLSDLYDLVAPELNDTTDAEIRPEDEAVG